MNVGDMYVHIYYHSFEYLLEKVDYKKLYFRTPLTPNDHLAHYTLSTR
jgi:hypothetical protein